MPAFRFNRRHLPTTLGLLAALTLAWYLVYSQLLVREMRRESEVHSRIVVRILSGLNDPSENAPIRTLVELSSEVQDLAFPIVYADVDGVPAYTANLPFRADPADSAGAAHILDYAKELARRNPPIVEPGLGTIYYGDTPTIERLRWIPWLQVGAMACLLIAAAWMIRHNARTERERIWAAMARESAHQMATPLSSLAGWVEILRLPEEEREDMASLPAVAAEMEADLDRLEKVARRFEWIGRPVQKEPVQVRPLLRVLERYVRVRLPQLRRSVEIQVDVAEGVPAIDGNGILLEWALENLIKNALDALAGAGGRILIEAAGLTEKRVEIRVSDNGPGVAERVRNTLFDPGITTKKGGWGVGLSLARRIVEDVHGGRMYLAESERGATFVMVLPAADIAAESESGPGLGLRARIGLPWGGTRTPPPEEEATPPAPLASSAEPAAVVDELLADDASEIGTMSSTDDAVASPSSDVSGGGRMPSTDQAVSSHSSDAGGVGGMPSTDDAVSSHSSDVGGIGRMPSTDQAVSSPASDVGGVAGMPSTEDSGSRGSRGGSSPSS